MKIPHITKPILGFLLLFTSVACSNRQGKEEIIVFHAGSLSMPLHKLSKAFSDDYPEMKLVTEAAGSVASARKITDLHRDADIMASSDYVVIDQFLIPDYASCNIRFATNSLVLAYTDHSAYAKEVSTENWLEILKRPKVNIGVSDPDADPCGYRSRLCLELAERFYAQDSIVDRLLTGDHCYVRPKETDLVSLLETNTIDYVLIYKSVAKQHGLNFVALPDSINLSKPELNAWYATASVDIRGKTPDEVIHVQGEAITYAITVLNDAPHQEAAWTFISWLLDPTKGGKIIKGCGQEPIYPAKVNSCKGLPADVLSKTILID
ncbi:MAG: extracellular solute-binding protein [Bacteroidetes bacterium]|nr:extracellular solute-binding protein [Bacteroidota bacterium]